MVIVMDVNLFTDIFKEVDEEKICRSICKAYISELRHDGVNPPLAVFNLPQDEGEDAWCVTCNIRFLCKAKRRVVNWIKRVWRRRGREIKFVLIVLSLWVGFPIFWYYSCSVILP